ncbi:MAG TPA: stage II sporulation protein M [Polyangia bacterium]|nr:stage II sporulation protein M [Polyangia bacterium]
MTAPPPRGPEAGGVAGRAPGGLAADVQRLESLIDQARHHPRRLARADLRDLPVMYRRVIAALAEARARGVPIAQLARLERVLIAAHGLLYAPEPPRLGRAFVALLREFPVVVRRSWRALALAVALCALGGGWGYSVVRSDPGRAAALLSPELLDNAHHFKSGAAREGDPLYGAFYFTNNATVAFSVYALGATFGLGTVLVLLYNGVMLGATLAIVLSLGASARFFSFVVAHGELEMLAVFIAAAAGLEMGWALLRPGWKRRSDALRDAAHATLPMALGASLLLAVAGLVEGWISPMPLPFSTKATLGASLLAGALVYLGRGRGRAPGDPVPSPSPRQSAGEG